MQFKLSGSKWTLWGIDVLKTYIYTHKTYTVTTAYTYIFETALGDKKLISIGRMHFPSIFVKWTFRALLIHAKLVATGNFDCQNIFYGVKKKKFVFTGKIHVMKIKSILRRVCKSIKICQPIVRTNLIRKRDRKRKKSKIFKKVVCRICVYDENTGICIQHTYLRE